MRMLMKQVTGGQNIPRTINLEYLQMRDIAQTGNPQKIDTEADITTFKTISGLDLENMDSSQIQCLTDAIENILERGGKCDLELIDKDGVKTMVHLEGPNSRNDSRGIDQNPLGPTAEVNRGTNVADNVPEESRIVDINPITSGEIVPGQTVNGVSYKMAIVNLESLPGIRATNGENANSSWATNADSSMVSRAIEIVTQPVWDNAIKRIMHNNPGMTEKAAEEKLIKQLWDFSFRVHANRDQYVRWHGDNPRVTGLIDSQTGGTLGVVDNKHDLRVGNPPADNPSYRPQFCIPTIEKDGEIIIEIPDPEKKPGKGISQLLGSGGWRYNVIKSNDTELTLRLTKNGWNNKDDRTLTFSLRGNPSTLGAMINGESVEDLVEVINRISKPGAPVGNRDTVDYFVADMARRANGKNSSPVEKALREFLHANQAVITQKLNWRN